MEKLARLSGLCLIGIGFLMGGGMVITNGLFTPWPGPFIVLVVPGAFIALGLIFYFNSGGTRQAFWRSAWPFMVAGSAVSIMIAANAGTHPRPAPSAPAVQPAAVASPSPSFQLVRWTYLRTECADGWQSSSIGKQGACSHHGGVVSVYEGSNGQVLRCGGDIPDPPRSERAQRKQLTEFGKLFCSDSAWR